MLDEFTSTNLPFTNPYEWISLFNIVLKYEKKYNPIVALMKSMLICYILEITNMDIKIVLLLQ